MDWLAGLPVGALYTVLALVAAVENVFPPFPADMVVALGSWLAARGKGNIVIALLAPWFGNLAGAAAMYFVGRRHGTAWLHRRMPALADPAGEERMRRLYSRYGLLALVLSRFVPGVRAVVPPFAGAMRLPAFGSIGAMAVASGIWYGGISYLAFRAGADWNHLQEVVSRSGRIVAAIAGALLAAGAAVWLVRRRRRATS